MCFKCERLKIGHGAAVMVFRIEEGRVRKLGRGMFRGFVDRPDWKRKDAVAMLRQEAALLVPEVAMPVGHYYQIKEELAGTKLSMKELKRATDEVMLVAEFQLDCGEVVYGHEFNWMRESEWYEQGYEDDPRVSPISVAKAREAYQAEIREMVN
jgi:hypothetical protein